MRTVCQPRQIERHFSLQIQMTFSRSFSRFLFVLRETGFNLKTNLLNERLS